MVSSKIDEIKDATRALEIINGVKEGRIASQPADELRRMIHRWPISHQKLCLHSCGPTKTRYALAKIKEWADRLLTEPAQEITTTTPPVEDATATQASAEAASSDTTASLESAGATSDADTADADGIAAAIAAAASTGKKRAK